MTASPPDLSRLCGAPNYSNSTSREGGLDMERLKRVLRLERAAGALRGLWRRGTSTQRLQRPRWWPGLVILVVVGVAIGVLLVCNNSGEESDLPEVFTAS